MNEYRMTNNRCPEFVGGYDSIVGNCEKDGWWNECRIHLQRCLDNENYTLDEFKSWSIVQYIPIWSTNPSVKDVMFDFLRSNIEPFLGNHDEERWKNVLIHERDFYRDVDDVTNNILLGDIGGVKSEITIGVHVLHWVILNQFGIDPKNLDFILEFGGGVGHIPKMVRKLGFRGKYGIFDFPEFSIIQQFYNNMEIVVINHLELIDLFLNNGDSGLFYSTWGFSEAPLELRKRIEQNLSCYKYCFILYQDEFEGIDNVKYFNDFANRNFNFDWTSVGLDGYPNNENNTYLIGVNRNYG
tara:strand:- start:102 stop:995 length:894 start_codon:yes stop_codon:yes gene_type:complete